MDGQASRLPPSLLNVNRSFEVNRLAGRYLAQAYQHLVPVIRAVLAPPLPRRLVETPKEMVQ